MKKVELTLYTINELMERGQSHLVALKNVRKTYHFYIKESIIRRYVVANLKNSGLDIVDVEFRQSPYGILYVVKYGDSKIEYCYLYQDNLAHTINGLIDKWYEEQGYKYDADMLSISDVVLFCQGDNILFMENGELFSPALMQYVREV